MPRPRIAVVGASVRGAAFSLMRAGCEVLAADLFADADLQQVCSATRVTHYPDGLAPWLADTPCDGWVYTGALENHPELIDHMAKLRPLFGNRSEVLRRVRDPLRLQEVLTGMGMNFPETKVCDGTHPGEGEWLHKTGQGGNGTGVTALDLQSNALPSTGFWQRRVPGVSCSAQYSAGSGSCSLLGVTRQLVGEDWTGAAAFQYCGTFTPGIFSPTVAQVLTSIGRRLAIPSGLCGIFGIDFVLAGDEVWVVEVNPRATAALEVVERTSGRNLLTEHLGAFGIHTERSDTLRVPAAGKVVLYGKQPLAVSPRLSEQLLAAAGGYDHPSLGDIPNPGTHISPGEPVLTILAEGLSLAEVDADLRRRVASLESTLYRDTGGN